MTGSSGAAEFFEELRREYLSEAAARLSELRKDLAALRAMEPDAANSLKVRLHRLAGSGGSYGFPAISSLSRATEQWLVANPTPDAAGLAHLETGLGKIAQAFDAAARELGLPAAPARPATFGWQALIVGESGELADSIEATLVDAQYHVARQPGSVEPARLAVSERPDVAVLLGTDPTASRDLAARWGKPGSSRPGAVILVTNGDGVDPLLPPFASLDGVVHPSRVESELLTSVRTLGRTATAPRSVLVVGREDEAPIKTVTTGLEGAAVRVVVTAAGVRVRDLLGQETPDLFLIDWKLPDTTALALIRWIRLQPAHRVTPIVVLAATVVDDERLQAIRAGADDMLAKAHVGPLLVQLVLARIERSRAVRSLAHRDDLTGLLNHEAMTEELERAVGTARRTAEPAAFFMIDLDHFRRVNEQRGQAVGDQVLVHVARLVAGSVRSSDLVARMGGEEFGVLVRRCKAADALRVADKVKNAVTAAPMASGGDPVAVRVSIGVACFPEHGGSSQDLLRAADRALTRAKHRGRDRVEVASA